MARFVEVTRLKNWKVADEAHNFLLKGIVYGHYSRHCHDGSTVSTSYINDVEMKEDEFVVHTRNTRYHLAYHDIAEEWNYRQDSAFLEFIENFRLGNVDEIIGTAVEEKQKHQDEVLADIAEKLGNAMLYIEVSDDALFNCNLAVYKNSNGKCSRAAIRMKDDDESAVITISDDNGECSVEYTVDIYHAMDFNNTLFSAIPDEKLTAPDGTIMGYIKNTGKNTLPIIFSWGKNTKIKPGSMIKVVYGMGQTETKPPEF